MIDPERIEAAAKKLHQIRMKRMEITRTAGHPPMDWLTWETENDYFKEQLREEAIACAEIILGESA